MQKIASAFVLAFTAACVSPSMVRYPDGKVELCSVTQLGPQIGIFAVAQWGCEATAQAKGAVVIDQDADREASRAATKGQPQKVCSIRANSCYFVDPNSGARLPIAEVPYK